MLKLIGILTVLICTFGGYMAMGGHLAVLWQPFEVVIIVGSGIGAFILSNTKHTIIEVVHGFKKLPQKDPFDKERYLELLSLMFVIFKLARTKGWLALEQHIENPDESELFGNFPNFVKNHHALIFLCDYLRIISLGSENPHELEALMDEELDTLTEEKMHPSHATQTLADGLPALGIVAAVLGIIKTMGAITEPPEVLGKLIGGALVGTFLGVWISYGFVAPIAGAMKSKSESEIKYYVCMKVGILAFLQGAAPQVAVEFARKSILADVQPTFLELEEATNNVPNVG